jgi:hypothetical protein
LRNLAGIPVETQSRAMNRAKEKPTMLAAMAPTIESENAVGQGQISGAAMTNAAPGTPKDCSNA